MRTDRNIEFEIDERATWNQKAESDKVYCVCKEVCIHGSLGENLNCIIFGATGPFFHDKHGT